MRKAVGWAGRQQGAGEASSPFPHLTVPQSVPLLTGDLSPFILQSHTSLTESARGCCPSPVTPSLPSSLPLLFRRVLPWGPALLCPDQPTPFPSPTRWMTSLQKGTWGPRCQQMCRGPPLESLVLPQRPGIWGHREDPYPTAHGTYPASRTDRAFTGTYLPVFFKLLFVPVFPERPVPSTPLRCQNIRRL